MMFHHFLLSPIVHHSFVFFYFVHLLFRKNMDREEGEVSNYRSDSRGYYEDDGRERKRVVIERLYDD